MQGILTMLHNMAFIHILKSVEFTLRVDLKDCGSFYCKNLSFCFVYVCISPYMNVYSDKVKKGVTFLVSCLHKHCAEYAKLPDNNW